MKKWLIILPVFLLLLLAGIYLFIPANLQISVISTINCPRPAADRFLINISQWRKWWPQPATNVDDADSSFSWNGYSYHINQVFTDKINLITGNKTDLIQSAINILPSDKNTTTLEWECSLPAGFNPVKRILQYRHAVSVKDNMGAVLKNLQDFLENKSNVYGFPVREVISKDSTLLATKFVTEQYPSTAEIYRSIDSLKLFISRAGASQTNNPMLRVIRLSGTRFETMVAIPTDKIVEGSGRFFFLRFVPWKTLTGTVMGGNHAIDSAFKQMDLFVSDNQRTSMAVPFQLLKTDRLNEPDSSKWITVICQPVS